MYIKIPYERIVLYLLLCCNDVKSISKYITLCRIDKIDGRSIKTYDNRIVKLLDIDELGVYNTKYETSSSSSVLDINTSIPKGLSGVTESVGIKSRNPYLNDKIKLICENIMLRRTIETYLTSRIDAQEICLLINSKFRIIDKINPEDLSEYRYWFYSISEMQPDDLDDYFRSLDKEEKEYKMMAYMEKEDYIKWRMQDKCEIDKEDAIHQIMTDAFFNYKEIMRSQDTISHSAAKTWSDIFFKAMDYVGKESDGSDIDIFKKIKININKDDDVDVISFSELVQGG